MVKFFFVLGVQVEEGSLLESSNLNLIRKKSFGASWLSGTAPVRWAGWASLRAAELEARVSPQLR